MEYKILFSNIGYARGIDGSLVQHIRSIGRNLYCPVPVQQQVIGQIKNLMTEEAPDLCCFVEVEAGRHYHHIHALSDETYAYSDLTGKYGETSLYSRLPFHTRKGNGLISNHPLVYEKLYLRHGIKKLVYRVTLPNGMTVLFAHLSLLPRTRALQINELRGMMDGIGGDVLLMADFNILSGLRELNPLLHDGVFSLMNDENTHTFSFHRHKLTLDLAICSAGLRDKMDLRVIPQPYSDHAALLARLNLAE